VLFKSILNTHADEVIDEAAGFPDRHRWCGHVAAGGKGAIRKRSPSWLFGTGWPPRPPWIDAWLQGLRDNGYEEGRNLKIEWALAAGKRELLPAMAADLVQKNVEVIVAATSLGGVAAKKATRTIPIVVLARCSIVKAQRTYGPRALAEHLGTARTPLVC
jgi:hypothetical protein